MDACPFCHTKVAEDLARFGGKCPSCFGHIPGEEAVTDPGHGVHETHHDVQRRSLTRVLSVALAIASAGLVTAAAWALFKPTPVATVLDFDDAGYAVGEMQFMAYVEPQPQAVEAPRPRIRRPVEPSATAEPVTDAEPETDAVVDVTPEPAVAPAPASLQFGLDVGVSRRATQGVRLTDDGAIIEMIKGVLTTESPKLKSCYEQRLKTREDLAGRWMLSLVVTRDGRATAVGVTGLDVADTDLESCIAGKVSAWSFQPIRADQPIQKTLGFTSGF